MCPLSYPNLLWKNVCIVLSLLNINILKTHIIIFVMLISPFIAIVHVNMFHDTIISNILSLAVLAFHLETINYLFYVVAIILYTIELCTKMVSGYLLKLVAPSVVTSLIIICV